MLLTIVKLESLEEERAADTMWLDAAMDLLYRAKHQAAACGAFL